ncbi:MAG: hypothetical protein ACYCXW_02550 [Solirubrobacteraceae bacterium]
MHELAPGLWHWTARHPHHGHEVSSYYLLAERVAIDPLLPAEGIAWFEQHEAPVEHVLMTNRHHDRDAWKLHEAFGCEVHCVVNGVHELTGRGPVIPFAFGDELPGGITAHEVGAICPDEGALYIPAHRALAVADGVVRWPGVEGLTFVPDSLMDDPVETKAALRDAYRRLLDLDFDLLLLAHGEPVTSGGKQALASFVGG